MSYLLSRKMVIVLLTCAPIVFTTACKKFLDVTPPPDLVTTDKVFADDRTVLAAMKGLYINIQSQFNLLNGESSKLGGLYSNEIESISGLVDDTVFWSNNLTKDNGTLRGIWTTAYVYIYHANEMIEKLPEAINVNSTLRKQLVAEARFLRGLLYFYLCNYFGDVPLILNTEVEVNLTLPRASSAIVYKQIIEDLIFAEESLPIGYLPDASFPSTKLRPCQLTASALLARVYLFSNDWLNAAIKANAVINAGTYSLEDNQNTVFLPSSREVILHFMPAQSPYNTAEGAYFVPGPSTEPSYKLADYLMNSFETGDLRKTYWTKQLVVNGQSGTYPYKYKVYQAVPFAEYSVVLRLAEQYLIRSEANAQQNKLKEAIQDLNIIRKRANLPPLSIPVEKSSVLAAIEHERQVELFAEWGHRWLDLKRWPSLVQPVDRLKSRADDILDIARNGTWQAYKKLWPIPGIELQRNKNLYQNFGY